MSTQSIVALQNFKCKANCKETKAIIEFIYDDYCSNPSEECSIIFNSEKTEISILFEAKDLESKFYSSYNANFQDMKICKNVLTIFGKDRINNDIKIKITLL